MSRKSFVLPPSKHAWPMEVVFTEDDDTTRADIVIDVAGRHHHGWGRTRRNPNDPDIPRIGEEIAAARALAHLASQLRVTAAEDIEDFAGRPVVVHL